MKNKLIFVTSLGSWEKKEKRTMPDKNSQLLQILELLQAYEAKNAKAGHEIQFLTEQLNCYSSSVDEPDQLFKSWSDFLLFLDYHNFKNLDQTESKNVISSVLSFLKSNKNLLNILTRHSTVEKIHQNLFELITQDFHSNEISHDCYFVVKYSNVLRELRESKMINPKQMNRLLFSLDCYSQFLFEHETEGDEFLNLKMDIDGITEFFEAIHGPQKWQAFWDDTSQDRDEYDIFQKLIRNIDLIVSKHTMVTGQITNVPLLWSELAVYASDLIRRASLLDNRDSNKTCRQQLIDKVAQAEATQAEIAQADQEEITPTPGEFLQGEGLP